MNDKLQEKPVLKVQLVKEVAGVPVYGHKDDAGFDICSIEEKILKPNERYLFKVGIATEIPKGWYVQIQARSGLAVKHGLQTMAGVVDAGYRGEWGILIVNLGNAPYTVNSGDKIAQGILLPIQQAQIIEVDELSDSERGQGGFGSTGQ